MSATRNSSSTADIKWSEIDKVKFYGIGTALYTGITIGLHPITVIKTRAQVSAPKKSSHINNTAALTNRIRGLYRGVGVILLLAVPARSVYICTLESSREAINETLSYYFSSTRHNDGTNKKEDPLNNVTLIATLSGGLSGGIAAASAQLIVVPMDIISQKQMVMDSATYKREGSISQIIKNILKSESSAANSGGSWKGLYRGFGVSLVSSLPTGSVWWATYSGCQQSLQSLPFFQTYSPNSTESSLYVRATQQLISGLSAAVVAVSFTQPLDVIKTRLQVGNVTEGASSISKVATNGNVILERPTYTTVTKELLSTQGISGLFRGTVPRVMHLGLWGTILSSAYEYLRVVSRKQDY